MRTKPILLLMLLLLSPVGFSQTAPVVAPLPGEIFNLGIAGQLRPDILYLTPTAPAQNWFAANLTNLPTDQPIALRILAGRNTVTEIHAGVANWGEFYPVMTCADPANYASYECFTRDERGRWVSNDPCKQGENRFAGAGPTPVQTVIPERTAAQYLTVDRAWCAWRDLQFVDAVPTLNMFEMQEIFPSASACIAMRVPYTTAYAQAFLERLRAAHLPGVTVDEVGVSPAGRALRVIRVTDPADPADAGSVADHRTVLLIARDRGTDHAGSWVVHGALLALLASTPEARKLRENTTWLLLPLLDPDAAAAALTMRIPDSFWSDMDPPPTDRGVQAFLRYFNDYTREGCTIDLALTFSSATTTRSENLACPRVDAAQRTALADFTRTLYPTLVAARFTTDTPSAWIVGRADRRLGGWCAFQFGSLAPFFEISDRHPITRLSLPRLQQLGAQLAVGVDAWCDSREGEKWHRKAQSTHTTEIHPDADL